VQYTCFFQAQRDEKISTFQNAARAPQVLKMERFSFAFFMYGRQRSHKSAKTINDRPVDGDVYTAISWTRNTHAHHETVFTNSHLCSLHGDDNGIIFKNLHVEIHFQDPKMQLSCNMKYTINIWFICVLDILGIFIIIKYIYNAMLIYIAFMNVYNNIISASWYEAM